MKIQVKDNFGALMKHIGAVEKQTRFAAAVALTRTAQSIKKQVPVQLERDLARPTPFTKNGLFIQAAKKDTLIAVVGFKDAQAKYMGYQIEGGRYDPTPGIGIKLPGNIQLNSFGNIPRGIINQLKKAAQDGQLSAAIGRRLNTEGGKRKGAAPVELFFGRPTGRGWEKAPVGIWRRIPKKDDNKAKLLPIILFEDTPAQYKPKFDFAGLAQKTVQKEFDDNFQTALKKAMETSR